MLISLEENVVIVDLSDIQKLLKKNKIKISRGLVLRDFMDIVPQYVDLQGKAFYAIKFSSEGTIQKDILLCTKERLLRFNRNRIKNSKS